MAVNHCRWLPTRCLRLSISQLDSNLSPTVPLFCVALCSESWLNIESVGDVGDSGTAGERGVVGVDAIARSPSVDARITSAGNACDVGEDGNPCAEGDVGQGNAGTGGIESVTETGPLKGRRAKRS